ncbi:hypothetical protein ACA910_005666 [Epithemia clementina (nom. ined.)]
MRLSCGTWAAWCFTLYCFYLLVSVLPIHGFLTVSSLTTATTTATTRAGVTLSTGIHTVLIVGGDGFDNRWFSVTRATKTSCFSSNEKTNNEKERDSVSENPEQDNDSQPQSTPLLPKQEQAAAAASFKTQQQSNAKQQPPPASPQPPPPTQRSTTTTDRNQDEADDDWMDRPFFRPEEHLDNDQAPPLLQWFAKLVEQDYDTAEALFASLFIAILVIVTQELLRIQMFGDHYIPFSSRGGGGGGGGNLF